jgi:2-amino-4-hydroxy-6-hydroxymethyldihydropteridine diphosphokinase
MTDAAAVPPPVLPDWAVAGERRRAHIARVTALLDTWAAALALPAADRQAWHDVGRWHDALRDAPPEALAASGAGTGLPPDAWHGPAAADRLAAEGEGRSDVLDAIRWHTVGHAAWGRTGRALYLADYLEPGRAFNRPERRFLAGQVVHDFDGVFRQVVRLRIEWTLREGKMLFPETAALWNAVR